MLFRPLTLNHLCYSNVTKFKKRFLPRLKKFYILVVYKFLIKKINVGFNQCISGHVISQNMEFITLAISQPF